MIFLECNNDEFLIKSLGFSKKQISHERCKGEVVKKVGKKNKAVGLIDEDPQSTPPREIKEYTKTRKCGDITLLTRKNDKNKHLIQVTPYLEHWFLVRAKSNKINPGDFNLPDNPIKLHGIAHIERKQNFRQFMKKLIENDSEIQTLKQWLKEALE